MGGRENKHANGPLIPLIYSLKQKIDVKRTSSFNYNGNDFFLYFFFRISWNYFPI